MCHFKILGLDLLHFIKDPNQTYLKPQHYKCVRGDVDFSFATKSLKNYAHQYANGPEVEAVR